MAKVQALLFIAALLPILNAYPLEDSSTTTEETTDKNGEGYVEETYIEVLLPGVSKLNSSYINSLLANNNASSTDASIIDKARPARDTSSNESDEDTSTESKDSKEDSSKEASPGLVSAQVSASPRPLRDVASKKQNQATTEANVEHLHPALVSASPKPLNRAVRDVSDGEEQKSSPTSIGGQKSQNPSAPTTEAIEKKNSHPALLSAQASAPSRAVRGVADQKASSVATGSTTEGQKSHPALLQNNAPTGFGSSSTTEGVLYVTKLAQPLSPYAVKN